MGGAARRRENRPVAAPATGGSCAFCGSDTQDETTVGRLYLLGSITVHYHCALLSCGLVQRGNDEEGLFGFLLEDILAELSRGKKLKCSYCSGGGATVACCITQCRKMFHLPCGRRRGSVSLFYGSYSSFCITHAPMQQIPESIMVKARSRKAFRSSKLRKSAKSSTLAGKETAEMSADSGEDAVCSICYEEVDSWPSTVTFWPPCCARDRWLHVPCIQRMALSAGMHYLKCPLCNDKETFQKTIASHGVYIPDRDASWELEGDAYADLYERPKSCSAEECKCYQGRSYDADEGRWELKLCLTCGSAAAHAGCLGAPRYVCERCSTVPPPDNLEALENIPLPRPETESAAPEYHPLMSCRMSVRRTKPSAARRTSSSVAIPDYFKMDRVVKVVKSQLHEDDLDDVDVESIDQPCCSKTDKQFTSENGPEKANYSIIKWLLCDDRSKQGRMLDIEPKKYCKPIERMTDCNTSNGLRNVCGCLWRRLIKKRERSIEEPSRRNKVILAEFGVDDTNEHKESVSDVQNEINIEKDIGNMLDESVICVDENDETSEINKSNNEVIEIESNQSLNEVIEIESNQSLDTLNYLGDDGVIDLTKSSLIRDRIQKWLERGSVNYPRNSLETNLAKGHVLIKNMPREIQNNRANDECLTDNKMLNQHITDDELLDKQIRNDELLDKHITDDELLDKQIPNDELLDKHITDDELLDKHITDDGLLDKHITDDVLLDKNITNDEHLDKHITNNLVLDEHAANNKMSVESNDATEGQLTDENPISENILDNKNEAHEKMLGKNENVNISSDKTDNQNASSDSNHEVLSSDNNFNNEKISSKTNEEKIISGSNDTNGNISSDGKVSSEDNDGNKILYTKDIDEIVPSDSTGKALNEVGDSPKKAFDKSALTELEDKIISPLKMIEEKIYARLTGNDDGGFKQRIDDNVRRMKKPRPMSVKKKVIENILERLLEDCNSGAPTERDPEAADDRIKTEGSTTQEYQSHCNKTHSSISAPSVSPGNTQNSTVQHSVDIDLATDNIDLSKNNVELSTDEIDLSIDNIVSPMKTLNTSTDSTKVEILKSALEISCQETVNIDYVRPSADALKVEGVKERGRIIFGVSASETCEGIQKYNRKHLKTGLNLKKRRNNVSEDILIESLKFDCENDDKVREGGKEKKSTDISPVRKWGAELSKTADLESFKSRYLSEVGQYKCNFTHKHKHEDMKESKPRIRTAIDYAIEAAVKQRRQTIEADAERAKLSNEIETSLKEDCNKKSILKDESVGDRKRHDKVVKFKNTQSNKTLEGVDKEPENRNHVTKRRRSESENDAPNTVVKVITPRKSIEVLQNLITAFENSNTSSGNIVLPSLSALGADPDVSKKEIQNTNALPAKVFSREKRIVVLQDTALVHARHDSEISVPKSGTSLKKPYSTPEKPVPTLEMPVSTLHQQIPLLDSLSMLDKPIQKFQNLISTVEKPPLEVENSISSVEKAKYKTMRPGVERQPLEKDVLKRGTVIEGMKKEFDKLNYVRLADKPHERVLVDEIDNIDDGGNFLVEGKELRRELLTENAPIRAKYRGDAKRRKRKRKGGVEKKSKKARYQEELEAINDTDSSRITTKINFENINDSAVKTKKGRRRKNKSYAKEIQKMKENEQLFDSLLTQNSARKTDAEKADEVTKLVEEKKANAKGEKRKKENVEAENEKSKEKKRLRAKRVEVNEQTDTAKRTDFYSECDSEREKNRRCDKKIKVNKREESESNEKSSEDSKQQKYSEKRKSRGKTADNIREIRKNNCDETKKSKNNDKGKQTVVETSEKQKTNKEKITMKSLNSEAGQEKKRKRRRVDYSDEHAFMGELDRVNEYYLKNIKRKKLNRSTETAKHVDTEPKLKQSILNFSPGGPKILSPPNDKEKTSHPISQKKKRKIHDFTADGLKQTTLNNFFSLHFTLT